MEQAHAILGHRSQGGTDRLIPSRGITRKIWSGKMDTATKGELSETLASASALAEGCTVARVIGHAHPYDFLVLRKNGTWAKVQVKTVLHRRNQDCVQCCRSKPVTNQPRNRKYADGAFDILAGVCLTTQRVYLFPFSEVRGKTQLACRDTERFRKWADF